MLRNIFVFFSLCIIQAQEIPYGLPHYFNIELNEPVKKINIEIPKEFQTNLFDQSNPIVEEGKDLYYLELELDKDEPIHFIILDSIFQQSSTLYFIDLNNNGWVGPYTKNSFYDNGHIITGQMKTKNILIELSISRGIPPKKHLGSIFHPKIMNVPDTRIIQRNIHREPNNKILLTGYWPPSNEAIRPFSQNHLLNPDGWVGENWENRGFDIVSYFPIFTDPDCQSCGQGYGDLEVDYQDTSEDWWNIVDSINPIAIITFSRGYIDHSWELEWQYFNYFYWTADFTEPFYPTPTPPDSTVPTNTRRYSSLPMDSIVSKIESSDLGLTPYIDYTQGAVGGLIDWDTVRQAAEITLREVIKVVDEYQNLPGDINQDGVISIYDMLEIIDHILSINTLEQDQINRADINLDTYVDIFDLLLLSNIILDW